MIINNRNTETALIWVQNWAEPELHNSENIDGDWTFIGTHENWGTGIRSQVIVLTYPNLTQPNLTQPNLT